MRNLTETIITYAFALAIIFTTMYAYRNTLTSFISRSFDNLTTATKDISRR